MRKLNLLTCLILLLTTGCAKQIGQEMSEQTRDSIRQEMLQASEAEPMQQPVTAPDEIMDQLVPAAGSAIPGLLDTIPSEPRFDISVANAPADVFFMSLVSDTDINMVVHPSVSGEVSLDLKKVTVEDVMQLAREVYGYEYKKTDNGYIVLPARIQSRIFHVNYLNIIRDGRSSMKVSSGQLADIDNSDNDSSDNDSSSSTKSVESSSINTSSKADFWSSLRATIVSIVGETEGRSVVVDPHAGLVVVRAMPGELRDVEAYIDSAQGNLQRQVILEAKIIEVKLDESHQSGIDWAALSESGADQLFAGQASIFSGSAALYNDSGEFDPGAALGNDSSENFANLFAIGGATDDFGFLLRLLDTQGDAQVLSSPRVSTVNNQKAVIKVGSDEFFVTDVSSTTTTGTATTLTTPSVTLTPFFSGIALDVTPQISQDNEVILHIHPSVSQVNDQTKNITIAGQTQQLPLALSTVRESDSVVKAVSGQVVVIGGLMQNLSGNNDASVPGLGDIPFIGNLFGQSKAQSTRSELVILLKPIVVDNAKTWSNYIKQSQQRIEQLQQPRPEAE